MLNILLTRLIIKTKERKREVWILKSERVQSSRERKRQGESTRNEEKMERENERISEKETKIQTDVQIDSLIECYLDKQIHFHFLLLS